MHQMVGRKTILCMNGSHRVQCRWTSHHDDYADDNDKYYDIYDDVSMIMMTIEMLCMNGSHRVLFIHFDHHNSDDDNDNLSSISMMMSRINYDDVNDDIIKWW